MKPLLNISFKMTDYTIKIFGEVIELSLHGLMRLRETLSKMHDTENISLYQNNLNKTQHSLIVENTNTVKAC